MRRCPDAGRSQIDFARLGLGISGKFGNRFGRDRWIYYHDHRKADEARDRRDIAEKNEIKLLVERRVDRVRRTRQEDRVAVRGRADHRLGADIAAATWAVFHDELLAEPLREPRSDEPRENVGRAAGARGGDDAHRPRRIGLRPSEARSCWQRGSACCEMQKLSTGKFHLNLPLSRFYSITSSASCWRCKGTSRPSALAVLRLIASSNLVGCITGKSAGLAPLRIRAT